MVASEKRHELSNCPDVVEPYTQVTDQSIREGLDAGLIESESTRVISNTICSLVATVHLATFPHAFYPYHTYT